MTDTPTTTNVMMIIPFLMMPFDNSPDRVSTATASFLATLSAGPSPDTSL